MSNLMSSERAPHIERGTRIIVDGYNFVGRDRGLRGPLAPKRIRLIERLSGYAKQTGCSMVVVFDGSPDRTVEEGSHEDDGKQSDSASIGVLYSGRGKKADDLIFETVMADAHVEEIVVTSDRALRSSVQTLHAKVLFCGQFEALLQNAGV